MSGKITGKVWDHMTHKDMSVRLTALAFADKADRNGRNVYPTIATIARMTEQSTRTVKRHVKILTEVGWLELMEYTRGRGRPNRYRIPIERIPEHFNGKLERLLPVEGETRPEERVTRTEAKEVTNERKGVTSEAKRGDTMVSHTTVLTVYRTENDEEKPDPKPETPTLEQRQAYLKAMRVAANQRRKRQEEAA